MIDIHSHILYGVDDGIKDLEGSKKILFEAHKAGVKEIVLTPHYHLKKCLIDQDAMLEALQELTKWIEEEKLGINLLLGRENDYEASSRNKKFIPMGNTNYVLVEFDSLTNDLSELCYNLRLDGFIPIIAHVERYDLSFEEIVDLKEEGNLIQVNARSILGLSKKGNKHLARKLIKKKIADFVSSDAHRLGDYDSLKKAYQRVRMMSDAEYTEKVFAKNAEVFK